MAAVTRRDPNIVEIVEVLKDWRKLEDLCVSHGLSPNPNYQNGAPLTGRPVKNLTYGECGQLRFNTSVPNCKGSVTKNMRNSPKGPRPWLMCGSCKKRSSELRGLPLASPSFFARVDSLGRPNVKLSKAEIIWLIFAKSHGLDTRQTRQLVDGLFDMGGHVQADWFHYVRELLAAERAAMPKLGGPGKVVQADEALADHYGGRVSGPWVFGIIDVESGELRLVHVRKRDAVTLCREIRRHVAPGTVIVTDEWAASDPDAPRQQRRPTQLDAHDIHRAGVGPAKRLLLRNMRGWCGCNARTARGRAAADRLMQTYLDWCWWQSMNGPAKCKDPFLRLLHVIARHYKQ
ncbi:unnamed protein product, partial [Ixodes hexagonus]